MRTVDIKALFAFTYWADRQVVEASSAVPAEAYSRPVPISYRDLRGTVVHTLDVEMSWRRRLLGEPRAIWDSSLAVEDYPTVAVFAERWLRTSPRCGPGSTA